MYVINGDGKDLCGMINPVAASMLMLLVPHIYTGIQNISVEENYACSYSHLTKVNLKYTKYWVFFNNLHQADEFAQYVSEYLYYDNIEHMIYVKDIKTDEIVKSYHL